MTDRLDRALRALREAEDGASEQSPATLERVLADLLARKRSPRKVARVVLGIAATLAVSSAALAGWRALQTTRDAPAASRAEPAAEKVASAPAPQAAPAPTTDPAVATGEASASAPAPAPASASARTPAAAPPPARAPATAGARATTPATATTPGLPSPPAPSARSDDEDVYTVAHRLHFAGAEPAAALAAWDDYLARFPGGRFVPDARYNRAIDLLRLRRYREAREALVPFASGAFGGYHRVDAENLLRSMPDAP